MKTTQPILAQAIEITTDELTIILPDRRVSISWALCPDSLKNATNAQRQRAELSPGGYGIHWPDIDEDLTIHGLVRLAEATR